jgi:hypothetical protein
MTVSKPPISVKESFGEIWCYDQVFFFQQFLSDSRFFYYRFIPYDVREMFLRALFEFDCLAKKYFVTRKTAVLVRERSDSESRKSERRYI